MLSIDPKNNIELPKALDLFNTKPITVGYNDASYVSYTSASSQGTFPIVFSINTGNSYVSLKDSYITLLLRMTKKSTVVNDDKTTSVKVTNLTAGDNASFANNVVGTVFKSVKFSLNSKVIENADQYHYKSYLINLLNLRNRSKTELQVSGYIPDESSHLSGKGFDQRKLFFLNDMWELTSKLDIDFWQQDKLLLPNQTIGLEISPSSADFALIAPDQSFSYSLIDIRLNLFQITLMPSLSLEIEKRLQTQLAIYEYDRYLIRNFFISGQRFEFTFPLFSSLTPHAIFCCFIDSHAYNGNYKLSPYQFEHANLRELKIQNNGKVLPTYNIKLSYEKNRYAHSFFHLIKSAKKCELTLEQFKNHSCIYAFNLDTDENANEPTKIGITNVSGTFDNSVRTHGLQLMVLAIFRQTISFDSNRQIISPFGQV